MLYEPKQVQTAVSLLLNFNCTRSWNIFQCCIIKLLESCFIQKTLCLYLEVLAKAISYDFLAVSEQQPTDFFSPPYNVLVIGRHDHLSNIVPLLAPDQFGDALIALFVFACNFFTQCGVYSSFFLFVQHVFKFLEFFTSISLRIDFMKKNYIKFPRSWIF